MSPSRAVNSQFAIHPAFPPVPLALAAVAAKSLDPGVRKLERREVAG